MDDFADVLRVFGAGVGVGVGAEVDVVASVWNVASLVTGVYLCLST